MPSWSESISPLKPGDVVRYTKGQFSFLCIVESIRYDEWGAILIRRDDDGRFVRAYPEHLYALPN